MDEVNLVVYDVRNIDRRWCANSGENWKDFVAKFGEGWVLVSLAIHLWA